MMRITNSMVVKRTKTNINTNRAKVDYTNNQMSSQKKITKPSDDPIIAIRALRLRSTLSTITQYYTNNIPDTESWMDCTQTALINMKDLLDDAREQVVYGSNDVLEQENRQAILKSLQSLQQQIYCEGNADYAGRTVFTGWKTNQNLTFTDAAEAKNQRYDITERFSYKDIQQKNYYAGRFSDTSDDKVTQPATGQPFNEVPLHRLRLAYDNIEQEGAKLSFSYSVVVGEDDDGNPITETVKTELSNNLRSVVTKGYGFALDGTDNLVPTSAPNGLYVDENDYEIEDVDDNTVKYVYPVYNEDEWKAYWEGDSDKEPVPVDTVEVFVKTDEDTGEVSLPAIITDSEGEAHEITYRVSTTSELKEGGYALADNEVVLDSESGELIFSDNLAKLFDQNRISFEFDYTKNGFETGELRPEYYFDCTRYMEDRDDITYKNYDEDGNWLTQGIFYNIAGGQQMQINTEAREIFNSDIRRDMDDLIEIVQMAISAQETVDAIKKKIESGNYDLDENGTDEQLKNLNAWLDVAQKQLDYANQNMHDTYSAYITRFQGYFDRVDLEITDLGGRGERVSLTKNRMSIQQSTFKELKSINEDMDLSELVINYSAASVAYQSALQAAAKIGKMTLLDFI